MSPNKMTVAAFVLYCCSIGVAQETSKFTVEFKLAFPDGPAGSLTLAQPQGLSVDSKGAVYVTDTGNNRVVKFKATGEFVDAIGGFGWRREEFDGPRGITVKSLLDVFVADYNNERIERYDKDLNFISSLQTAEALAPTLQFGFPTSVDISKHGELFICDSENDRILKLNSFGEPILSFGGFNWGEGRLESPVEIEVTGSDLVFVTDGGSNEIVVFDYYGTFVTRFGSLDLKQPGGLSWSQGFLLVADSGNNRIVAFDNDFRLAMTWGQKGDKHGAFDHPSDVAIYKDQIYVLDTNNNRVQVFRMIERKKS